MMLHPFRSTLSLCAATLAAVVIAGTALAAFVPGTEDVPLAPGLIANADDALVFDNPTGRIVQATAVGAADTDAVTRFYADTLPQLGWTRGKDGRWTRGEEVLDIAIARDASGHRLSVRFQLSPSGN